MNAERTVPAWVCPLTPAGRGALAVVSLWGPEALRIADDAFRPYRPPSLLATSPGVPRVGTLGPGPGDEVVAIVLDRKPPEVEIHCHGGPAALACVLQELIAQGARRCRLEGARRSGARLSPSAVADLKLAAAPTARVAEVLLDQSRGALEAEVERLLTRLPGAPEAAREGAESLLRRSAFGRRLLSGWRVVLFGRPNVGKSRLVNALAGYDRVIVDPTAGTTRDVVTVRTAIEGWPVEVADTAGWRASGDPIEADGIRHALGYLDVADLALLVLDRSQPLTPTDLALLRRHPDALPVANKSDLEPAWDPIPDRMVAVSATTGAGLEPLLGRIARRLVPDPPRPMEAVPLARRHRLLLEQAADLIAAGQTDAAAAVLASVVS